MIINIFDLMRYKIDLTQVITFIIQSDIIKLLRYEITRLKIGIIRLMWAIHLVSKWSYYFVKWYNLLCLGWLWWLYRATNSDNSADPEDQNESFWRLGGRKNNPHRVHASRVFFRSQISAIYFCDERHQKARPFHKNIFFYSGL